MGKQLLHVLATDRHVAERTHLVCILGTINYLVIFGAGSLMLGVAINTFVILRDIHMTALAHAGEELLSPGAKAS